MKLIFALEKESTIVESYIDHSNIVESYIDHMQTHQHTSKNLVVLKAFIKY